MLAVYCNQTRCNQQFANHDGSLEIEFGDSFDINMVNYVEKIKEKKIHDFTDHIIEEEDDDHQKPMIQHDDQDQDQDQDDQDQEKEKETIISKNNVDNDFHKEIVSEEINIENIDLGTTFGDFFGKDLQKPNIKCVDGEAFVTALACK